MRTREERQERRHARRRERDRRHALRAKSAQARRTRVLKAVAVAVLVAATVLLALLVGTADYEACAIGWVPCIMVVTAVVLAWVYLQILKRGLSFSEVAGKSDCRRDTDVDFRVSFVNKTVLLFFHIDAYFTISDMFGNAANEAKTTLALGPRERYDLAFTTRFEHIGTYAAGLDRIVIADFLNLFTATIVNERRREVHVTPKVQDIAEVAFSQDSEDEALFAAKSQLADSMDYAYVREYEPGDPLKTIHWKLSARSQTYMTRLYEVYANPGVSIIMDFFGPSEDASVLMGMFDAVVESAFSFGEYARAQGMDTDLRYRSRDGERVTLRSWDVADLSETVADLPRMSNDPATAGYAIDLVDDVAQAAHGQNNVIVCSANVSPAMVSAVLAIKGVRRAPIFVAVVPTTLVGREREDWCRNLGQLDDAGIPCIVIARSDELVGVSA